jgi:hypothetical protein
MTRSALPLALIACLAASGRTLAAEEPPAGASHGRAFSAFARPRLDVGNPSLTLQGLADAPQPAQRRSSRDSVRNGAIIGAIAGALGAGAFGGLICHLYQEDGGPSCWPDALRVAAIGAAIGTGAGIAVDAARTRHPGVGVRISVTF